MLGEFGNEGCGGGGDRVGEGVGMWQAGVEGTRRKRVKGEEGKKGREKF